MSVDVHWVSDGVVVLNMDDEGFVAAEVVDIPFCGEVSDVGG